MAAKLSLDDFKQVLTDALADVKGITQEGLDQLTTKYAPRLAALPYSDDPQGEFDDITTNEEIAALTLGVKAESVPGQTAIAAVKVAAGIALRLAVV